jgi:fructokinase
VFSPERIVLGGGVTERRGWLETVGARLRELVAGYLPPPLLGGRHRQVPVAPGLGDPAGVPGARALAETAVKARVDA